MVSLHTHVSSLTAYVRVLRECIRAVVSASGLVPLESALIPNLRCLFPACRGFHWFPVSHTKPVAMVTPTEYFLGLIFTPALAPPNGTSGTEGAVRDVLVLMSAEVSQVCAGTPVRLYAGLFLGVGSQQLLITINEVILVKLDQTFGENVLWFLFRVLWLSA